MSHNSYLEHFRANIQTGQVFLQGQIRITWMTLKEPDLIYMFMEQAMVDDSEFPSMGR